MLNAERDRVLDLCRATGSRDVLVYGGWVEGWLPFPLNVQGPADIVAGLNVLEGSDPDDLCEILDDLWSLTRRVAFLTIDLNVDKKKPLDWAVAVTRRCTSPEMLVQEAAIVHGGWMEMTLWKTRSAST